MIARIHRMSDPVRSIPVVGSGVTHTLHLLTVAALGLALSLPATATTLTRTSAFTYDAGSGLLVKEVIEPDSSTLCLVTEYVYDGYGNKTSATTRNCNGSAPEAAAPTGDPVIASRTSSNTYDSRGQFPTTSSNALSQSESKTYDARFGTVLSLTGPNALTTTWTYDGFGRKTLETRADGTQTKWEYDPFGNLTQTTDPLGNVTTLTYDLRGRKTGMQDPDMGSWSYAYNALGQLIRQTDALSQVSTLTYDLLGRLIQRSEADLISNWYYDSYKNNVTCPKGIGKLCQAETSTGYTRSHSYDSLGRPVSTSTTLDVTYTSGVTYDTQGRVATQSFPSGLTVKVGYTALGYLKDLRNNTTNALYWQADSQDAEGHLLGQTFGNGVQTAQSYNAANGRLTGILSGAGNGVQNFTYQYDSLGNITSRTDGNQSLAETFVYDSLNRLTSSTVNSSGAGIITKTYAYDVLGNLTSRSDLGSYSYPASGASSVRPHALSQVALTAGGRRTYSYDGNGNLTAEVQYDAADQVIASKGRTEFYTSFNMPQSMGSPSVSSAFYYGPEHQRVKQVSSTLGTTFYLNPGSNGDLLFEKDIKPDSSVEERHFLTAGGQVVALIKRINGTTWSTRYLHRDNLGSTTAITDETGTVIERLAYEPFGKRRFAIGTDDPNNTIVPLTTERGFTNHEHIDELALIHMNGRVYDPTLGRFMSPDFANQDPMDLQAYNRYGYARNNPLMYRDPSGQFFGIDDIIFVAVAVFVGAEVAHQVGIIDTSTTRMIQGIAVAAAIGSPAGATALGFGGVGQAMVAGFAGGFVGSNFNIEGGVYGAATAAMFYWAGTQGFQGYQAVAANAAVGCASSALSGGSCRQGALSAGIPALVDAKIGYFRDNYQQIVFKAVVGGTTSVLGGGKFGNGATTAAFSAMFTGAIGSSKYTDSFGTPEGLQADLGENGLRSGLRPLNVTFFKNFTFEFTSDGWFANSTLQVGHEQQFFTDSSGRMDNAGHDPNGLIRDPNFPGNIQEYRFMPRMYISDTTVNQIRTQTFPGFEPGTYDLIRHNCQDFGTAVRKSCN